MINLLFLIPGTTAEDFVHRPKLPEGGVAAYGKSKYDMLRDKLAAVLNIPVGNVDIFTIMNHPELPNTIDVRYAAHNSPYYRAAKLDGIMAQRLKEVSDMVERLYHLLFIGSSSSFL